MCHVPVLLIPWRLHIVLPDMLLREGSQQVNVEMLYTFQDFCYKDDPDTFNLIEVIDMCVTVVVYSPDSFRSVQMLVNLLLILTVIALYYVNMEVFFEIRVTVGSHL